MKITPKEAALEIARQMIPYVDTWDCYWDEPNYQFNDLKAALVAVNQLASFTSLADREFWIEAQRFLISEIYRRKKLYED